jgi:hypothetical protein
MLTCSGEVFTGFAPIKNSTAQSCAAQFVLEIPQRPQNFRYRFLNAVGHVRTPLQSVSSKRFFGLSGSAPSSEMSHLLGRSEV